MVIFGRSRSHVHTVDKIILPEPCRAAAHDLALAHELGVELGTVEREVDVKVHAVEGALWSVHALKVLFEVLAAEIGGERNNLLDTCECVSEAALDQLAGFITYEDPWCTQDTRPHRKRRGHPRT